jgi:hypothetical protein
MALMAASKTTETVIKVYCFFPLLDLLLKKKIIPFLATILCCAIKTKQK